MRGSLEGETDPHGEVQVAAVDLVSGKVGFRLPILSVDHLRAGDGEA
ncbi:hypothetical protein [Nonomuraea sp. NPDC003214]